jgi:hypothetical protein
MCRRVVVIYSHQDRVWLERLNVHLRPLVGKGAIDLWADTRIGPGERWRSKIASALHGARAAILLVTADFIDSDFIRTEELPRLLEEAADGGCRILPVIVGPSLFQRFPELAGFQSVNPPNRPLIAMSKHEQEEVFLGLALELMELFPLDAPLRE